MNASAPEAGELDGNVVVLGGNAWAQLHRVDQPGRPVDGYTFLHEARAYRSTIVVVAVYRQQAGRWEVFVRDELCPAWSTTQTRTTVVTGGAEHGDFRAHAALEVAEETGYRVDGGMLVELGAVHASKASDGRYLLFGVDVTGLDAGDAVGDGTVLDSAQGRWMPADGIRLDDAVAECCVARLLAHLDA